MDTFNRDMARYRELEMMKGRGLLDPMQEFELEVIWRRWLMFSEPKPPEGSAAIRSLDEISKLNEHEDN
jgi:hypothetical protein